MRTPLYMIDILILCIHIYMLGPHLNTIGMLTRPLRNIDVLIPGPYTIYTCSLRQYTIDMPTQPQHSRHAHLPLCTIDMLFPRIHSAR